MKCKQPKLGFAILALLTVGTLALAYKHNIDYQRHVQELKKEYADLGTNPGILDLDPLHIWGNGPPRDSLGNHEYCLVDGLTCYLAQRTYENRG